MKTLKNLLVLAISISAFTFISCQSDDNGGGGGAVEAGTLTAQIDGVTFQSLEISSSATLANAGGTLNLVIIASNSDGNAFSIVIFGYDGTGTYDITGDNIAILNTASYSETDISDPMNPSTEIWQAPFDNTMVGSVSISEETDTNVKGTFSFTCKNVNGDGSVKTISDGSFDLDKQTT
jgi:hypothetical protein